MYSYSKKLLNDYKEFKKCDQYKQLAHELHFSQSHITEINRGRRVITEKTATYIAREMGLDLQEVLLNLAMERADSEVARAAWRDLAKKLFGTSKNIATGLAIAVLSVGYGKNADAKDLNLAIEPIAHNVELRIM